MTQIPNNAGTEPFLTIDERDRQLQQRVFRTMSLASVGAMIWSVFFSSWPVTIGLALGGMLALLNHRWLHSSVSAAFGVLLKGQAPRITVGKFIFRYLVVGGVVFATYQLGIASLPALIVGLSTFVIALFVEAVREFYLAIIRREEIG